MIMFVCRTAVLCCFIGLVFSAASSTEKEHELARRFFDLRQRLRSTRQSNNFHADFERYVEKLVREVLSSNLDQQGLNSPPKANQGPKPALSQREWTFLYDGGARGTSPKPDKTVGPLRTTSSAPPPSNAGNNDVTSSPPNANAGNNDVTTLPPKANTGNDDDKTQPDKPVPKETEKKVFKCQSLILTLLKDGQVSVQVGEAKD